MMNVLLLLCFQFECYTCVKCHDFRIPAEFQGYETSELHLKVHFDACSENDIINDVIIFSN